MPSYNKVILLGNLVRDPEMRVTPKGTPVCQFGLAVNHKYKTDSGEMREEVTFVDFEAWGKQAETIAKYCTKGKPLFTEGRLKLDQWDDKASGQKRSKLKVVLENFQFIGGKEQDTDAPPAPSRGQPANPLSRPPPTEAQQANQGGGGDSGDVPFSSLRDFAQ